MTTTGKMRRRRNNRAGCHDAPANNARGFGKPTTSPRFRGAHNFPSPMCRNHRQMIAYEIVSGKRIKTPKLN